MSPLGKLVREARRSKALSQRALGALLRTPAKPDGVWSTYVGQVEHGRRVPPDSMVLQFAAVLDIDPDHMLAAAYQSRAHTVTGRKLFALAPLLLFIHRYAGAEELNWRAAVGTLRCLAESRGRPGFDRLLQALAQLEPLDERRWHLLRNAVAALRSGAADQGGAPQDARIDRG